MLTASPNSSNDIASTLNAKKGTSMNGPNNKKQRAYSREVTAIGIGGLLAGLTSAGLQLIANGPHGAALTVLSFGAVMGIAASFLDHREGSSVLRVVLGALGGILMAMTVGIHPLLAAALGGTLIGGAFSLRFGNTTAQKGMVIGGYAFALTIGTFIASVLLNVGFFKSFNAPVISDILTTGLWSLALMLPGGLKFLDWQTDEIESEYKVARAELKGKHRETIDSALLTYGRIRDEVNREDQSDVRERAESIAHEVSRGLISLTRRAAELEETVSRTSQSPLAKRAMSLESRIRTANDKALKKELVAALEEVVAQMRTRRRMEAACVRIEARQQRFLTALERLHVSLVQNDRLAASDGSTSESLDRLSKLTEEVRWSNLSVDELCGSDFDEDETENTEQLDALLSELHGMNSDEATMRHDKIEPPSGVILDTTSTPDSERVFDLDDENEGVDGFVADDQPVTTQENHVSQAHSE